MAGSGHTASTLWAAAASSGAADSGTDGFERGTVVSVIDLVGRINNALSRFFRGLERCAHGEC